MEVKTRAVFGYVALPRVLPRVRELLSLTFSHTAYFIALIFESVRLLPSGHPYLKSDYFGHFSISQVLVEAYKRLNYSRYNLDQLFIFYTIVLGIFLLFTQIIILAFSALFPLAHATTLANPYSLADEFGAGFTLSSIIETRFPQNDIAFMLLDRVFGVDDMYNSRIDPTGIGAGAFPLPYHYGLQAMFQTYSVALLTVGMLILTYFVITIAAETVRDGTPFGKRFNRVWAPVRLVMAFGLLVPLSNGLNASQYIVLVAAKWGSGFATNGLTYYYGDIHDIGSTPFGPPESLIATPNPPDTAPLLQFILTARACQFAVQFYQNYNHHPGMGPVGVETPIQGYYLVSGPSGVDANPFPLFPQTGAGTINEAALNTIVSSETALESVVIIFGHQDPSYAQDLANVRPYCGSITMPVVAAGSQMARDLQARYLTVIAEMWADTDLTDAAAALAYSKFNSATTCNTADYPVSACPPPPAPIMSDFKATKTRQYRDRLRAEITNVVNAHAASLEWCGPASDPYRLGYGWAGAAICYNRIAQYNGDLTAAAAAFPAPYAWPLGMEYVRQKRQEKEYAIDVIERFNPILSGENEESDIFDGNAKLRVPAEAEYEAYRQWIRSGIGSGDGLSVELSGSSVKDIINLIFGTEGIFNMTKPENRNIHPLAHLAAAGRGLIEAAIRNIGIAGVGLSLALFGGGNMMAEVSASFLLSFAVAMMSTGFILYYMLPLLPFLYFFFAVGTWIKTIFEAMVGAPLWALAHLRIDGDGIPGNAAMSGYLLILEIFLRPILILFGLLASTLIFAAMAKVLNELWTLVVENITGFDQVEAESGGYTLLDIEFWRSPIDEFFYTILYVIMIYMIGLSCFKLIDLIPNYILRWVGQSVNTFAENVGDSTAELSQKANVGVYAASSKVIEGAEGLMTGTQNSVRSYQASKSAAETAG